MKEPSVCRNLIYSLILFGKIKTTQARAKVVAQKVDRLVTKMKKGTMVGKREVLSFLPQKSVIEKLEKEIVSRQLAGRSSGYTRMTKLGERLGDRAKMVLLEWVVESESNLPKAVKNDKTDKIK